MQHHQHNVLLHHYHKRTNSPATTPQRPNKKRALHATPPRSHHARKGIPQHTQHSTSIPPPNSDPPTPASHHLGPNATAPTEDDIFASLTATQSKYNPDVPTRGLMFPGKLAQCHSAGPLLQQYGSVGCPVDVTENWTLEQLDAAVAYGAHPSASTPAAAEALRKEALEKVEQGFAKLIPWKDLRQQITEGQKLHTKISPIAAIPHKSRLFRMILDLSRKGQRRRGQVPTTSVNDLTNEDAAPHISMVQLGSSLGRVIFFLATQSEEDGPVMMCKFDIKDGFWRMCVPEQDEEQFCYVLPNDPNSPGAEPQLVVPAALQMGWKSSPAFFCAATETGRDIAEFLRKQPRLPPHPLEHHTIDPIDPDCVSQFPFPNTENLSPHDRALFQERLHHLFEVYVDDYIGLLNSTDPKMLRHHSRALLHAIHQIFPPPDATGHAGENPISYKKLVLDGEGVWAVRKEILGWIFDGYRRTMELPPKKVQDLRDTLQRILRQGHYPTDKFESLIGKCQHGCMGIPGGTAVLPPLYQALHSAKQANKASVIIHPASSQQLALRDLRTLFLVMSKRPTHCKQLIPGFPGYIGYCDACKWGAGGVWISGSRGLRPIVWRFPWPPLVIKRFEANEITVNDLEMAGVLLEYLLLEQLVDVKHLHTAVWCDNTSAVSWMSRMGSKKSKVGQQLTRAFALRMCTNLSSHLAPMSIAGSDNDMADLSSRSFKATGAAGNYNLSDHAFLTKFNYDFPLTQDASWLMLRLHTRLSSLVCTVLQGEMPLTGSWLRLTKSGCDIGLTGPPSAPNTVTWTPFSPALMTETGLTSSAPLPAWYVKAEQDEAIKSELVRFRQRFAPSARPSNWLSNPTPSTHQAVPTPTGES